MDRIATPFGDEHTVTGTLTQKLQFPGQIEETETDFYQNWRRDYDPELGRYVQSDPIGLLGGINTYGYVGGNPVSYVDPEGEFANFVVGALIGGGLDLGLQLLMNGGNFECVKWGQVATSAALGAVGGGVGGTLQKARNVRQAYQSGLKAARNKGLSPPQAHALRRQLGAKLKGQTPQPFRSMIHRRNLRKYGDKLGPTFNPTRHSNVTKSLTDTNRLLDAMLQLPSSGLATGGAFAGGITGNLLGNRRLENKCGCP